MSYVIGKNLNISQKMAKRAFFEKFLSYVLGKNLKIYQKNGKKGKNRKVFELCSREESGNMSKKWKKE